MEEPPAEAVAADGCSLTQLFSFISNTNKNDNFRIRSGSQCADVIFIGEKHLILDRLVIVSNVSLEIMIMAEDFLSMICL